MIQTDGTASAAENAADDGRRAWARRVTLPTMATIFVVAAVLHFGSEVFLPLAIATLIAFALAPVVSALRRRGWPRVVAVITAFSRCRILPMQPRG
jgi:predicted PurR-regulated permease PerM